MVKVWSERASPSSMPAILTVCSDASSKMLTLEMDVIVGGALAGEPNAFS